MCGRRGWGEEQWIQRRRKERERENREETERGGKGRSQRWKYELRMGLYISYDQIHSRINTAGTVQQNNKNFASACCHNPIIASIRP